MSKYKVIYHFSDPEDDEEEDELFDTYEEAWSAGEYGMGCYETGAETLSWSNPGDYPLEDANLPEDFEVVEVDGDEE